MIAASFSSRSFEDLELLGADQEQVPKTQASTHDAGSSSAMPPCQGGDPSYRIHLTGCTRLS
jgi:hypothetical protein